MTYELYVMRGGHPALVDEGEALHALWKKVKGFYPKAVVWNAGMDVPFARPYVSSFAADPDAIGRGPARLFVYEDRRAWERAVEGEGDRLTTDADRIYVQAVAFLRMTEGARQ